jgi:hypothetical protein
MAITSHALAFAARWFDAATVRRTFEPLIADWQREWHDAPPARRRWISLRGLGAFIVAVVVSSPRIVLTPAPPAVIQRVAVRMTCVIAVLTVILMIPPVISLWMRWTAGSTWISGPLFLFTLPKALALAFPFAMAAAVDAIRRPDVLPAHVERAAAVRLGAFAAAFMLFYGGWVMPAASEASRQVINPPGMGAPLRGMQELSTVELILDPARATVFAPGTALASRSTSIQRELNNRAAWIALPLILLWLRWRAHDQPRRRWFAPLPAWMAIAITIGVMWTASTAGLRMERDFHWFAGSRYWAPIAMFWVWGMMASHGRRLLTAPA